MCRRDLARTARWRRPTRAALLVAARLGENSIMTVPSSKYGVPAGLAAAWPTAPTSPAGDNRHACGFPTNGRYGFSQIGQAIAEYRRWRDRRWDASEKTFRPRLREYKADRPSMPDLLSEQWPHFRELVEAFG